MAFGTRLFGLKVPLPPLQTPPVAPLTVPLSVMFDAFAQTVPPTPASTIGAGVMKMVRVSVAALQVPFPVVVSVSVTWPAAMSAAPGV